MEDADHRVLTGRLTAAGIVLPFVLAVVVQAVGTRPGPVAAAPLRPALAFDQHLVDLHEAPPSEEVFAHFDFKNRGKAPVTVTELVPSCGCLQPQLKKKIYLPGQSGRFFVRVETANEKPGPKDYHIAVKYVDPEPRVADLFFRVVLADNQVSVRPRALTFYQFSDRSTTREIEVLDRRGRHLNITRVECTKNVAEVEIKDGLVDEAGQWRGHLAVTVPGNVPPGRVDATLNIFTDDPAYHMLRVPLRVEGRPATTLHDRQVTPAGGTKSQ